MPVFQPHPFHWAPAGGRRHAVAGARPPGGHPGLAVEALCGERVIGDESEGAWLWGTCPECNTTVRHIVEGS